MKIRGLILTSIAHAFAYFSFAQAPPIQWDKTFGGNNYEQFNIVKQTSDGGYISGGWSQSPVSGSKSQPNWDPSNGTPDYWIVKTDALGVKQWDKRFGGTNWETFGSLQQTADGGYIIGGYSSSSANGDKSQTSRGLIDYWIVKLDAAGIQQWDARFGGSANDYLTTVIQTSDGGYMLCGFSGSGSSGDRSQSNQGANDYWIVKTDANGVKQWDKRFGGPQDDWAYSIVQTTDGGYIIGGTSASGAGGDKSQANRGPLNTMDYWIIKTDASGNKLWDKRFGTSDDDLCCVALQTSDGGFVLGGYSSGTANGDRSVNSRGSYDYWVLKTDAAGIKLWDKRYGGSEIDYLFAMEITTDDGFIMGGTSYSGISGDKTQASRGNEDYWIIKTDDSGNILWDKTMGGSDSDWLNYIDQTMDGYYIAGGWSNSGINGEKTQALVGISDYWLVKLGPPVSLPVKIISFYGQATEHSVQLRWQTACEINNQGFMVERSSDGNEFKEIGWVNGKGNTNSVSDFLFDDKTVLENGIYYYRLRQVDYDGAESLSETISIYFNKRNLIKTSQNPFTENCTITFQTAGGKVKIYLAGLDRKNRCILDGEVGNSELEITLSKQNLHLTPGIYFLTIVSDNIFLTEKLIVE